MHVKSCHERDSYKVTRSLINPGSGATFWRECFNCLLAAADLALMKSLFTTETTSGRPVAGLSFWLLMKLCRAVVILSHSAAKRFINFEV